MKEYNLTPKEQLTLEPYERDHAMILGTYRWFKVIKREIICQKMFY